jgi:CDP-diacylglycerol--glycerol-3-phosphate 3-phosphatidyltransferase
MELKNSLTFPNLLTLIRLIGSPLVLPLFLVVFLPANILSINYALGLLFVIFALTDFFDGYLARRLGQVTVLGAMLDPIADKFLFYSSLIGLLAAQKIFFYWVIILIGREFFIMGLRMIALEHSFFIPVSFWAKAKTVVEMIYITVVIINPHTRFSWFENIYGWNGLELIFLIGTLTMSVSTAYWYYKDFMQTLKKHYLARDVHAL